MGKIIDGKLISQKLRMEIKDLIEERIKLGFRRPCLASILVGEDGGSLYYMNNQKNICDKLNVQYKKVLLNKNIDEVQLIEVINNLNNDKEIDGIIIQMPLPKHINEKKITSNLNYLKDVDGLTDVNLGKFYKGDDCFEPCTPQSIIHLIKSTGFNIEGKHAVIIGRSNIVGKPVWELLLRENATVTMCHSKTKNLKNICNQADILICAIGKPEFINAEYIKEGAIVIDVGTTKVNDEIKGDVLFNEVISKASYITPVPGGVGAMTTTMLIKNTYKAWLKNVY
ncbi:methylenetetrahydrofolate dehydrogenase (NADP+) / methenyltetrahydrofolate cyclohydrolase [Clostridium sp. USBA 49]|uniref:bifunctional 5,10-methylenetetrahydrofolate dehydrogenase/5,10-methenyltetrahydrofolate cyclohydrolase n=1 Tax=Clostridium TaxID=1485 RepID=UPI000999CFA1|nr:MULTISPECIES: tetrahydrofolate dehydrogenase/cyclohydrolase catalytic domain-containing protein [Clostridium]SKA76782.1 methylenetetrahydrofolate dehydrogenase (NADP+) / methenyltetrahydrofolate cyclohydrolase [Clostridium sp. USBA 49]